MSPGQRHDELIQQEFTKQAQAYAANPQHSDAARLARFVQAVAPRPQDRVLEVATGPGYVAMAFAEVAGEVVGLDLTAAPLAIAEQTRQARGLTNVRFEQGNAAQVPYDDGAFDVVVCRLALHHVETPAQILGEMTRVCKVGGKIGVDDLVVSEHPARADYQNHVERLRDPSHVTALPLSQVLTLFARAGLEVEHVHTEDTPSAVETWLQNAQTPAAEADQARQLLSRDADEDLSLMRPYRDADGRLWFRHLRTIVVGRKLAPAG